MRTVATVVLAVALGCGATAGTAVAAARVPLPQPFVSPSGSASSPSTVPPPVPAMTVSPTSGRPAQLLTITGVNWLPDGPPVAIWMERVGPLIAPGLVTTATPDEGGGFTVTAIEPFQPAGDYVLAACENCAESGFKPIAACQREPTLPLCAVFTVLVPPTSPTSRTVTSHPRTQPATQPATSRSNVVGVAPTSTTLPPRASIVLAVIVLLVVIVIGSLLDLRIRDGRHAPHRAPQQWLVRRAGRDWSETPPHADDHLRVPRVDLRLVTRAGAPSYRVAEEGRR